MGLLLKLTGDATASESNVGKPNHHQVTAKKQAPAHADGDTSVLQLLKYSCQVQYLHAFGALNARLASLYAPW